MPEKLSVPTVMDKGQDVEIPIHASIRVNIGLKKRREARLILGSIIEQTQFEEGCISCRLYQDVLIKGVFMLEEIWTSEQALHRHLQSDKFHTVLLVIEMAAEAPEIRFDTIAHSTGISTIKKARGGL